MASHPDASLNHRDPADEDLQILPPELIAQIGLSLSLNESIATLRELALCSKSSYIACLPHLLKTVDLAHASPEAAENFLSDYWSTHIAIDDPNSNFSKFKYVRHVSLGYRRTGLVSEIFSRCLNLERLEIGSKATLRTHRVIRALSVLSPPSLHRFSIILDRVQVFDTVSYPQELPLLPHTVSTIDVTFEQNADFVTIPDALSYIRRKSPGLKYLNLDLSRSPNAAYELACRSVPYKSFLTRLEIPASSASYYNPTNQLTPSQEPVILPNVKVLAIVYGGPENRLIQFPDVAGSFPGLQTLVLKDFEILGLYNKALKLPSHVKKLVVAGVDLKVTAMKNEFVERVRGNLKELIVANGCEVVYQADPDLVSLGEEAERAAWALEEIFWKSVGAKWRVGRKRRRTGTWTPGTGTGPMETKGAEEDA